MSQKPPPRQPFVEFALAAFSRNHGPRKRWISNFQFLYNAKKKNTSHIKLMTQDILVPTSLVVQQELQGKHKCIGFVNYR